MIRKAKTGGTREVAVGIANMLVGYLRINLPKGEDHEELCERTGIPIYILDAPHWADIPTICKGANLDVGLALRHRSGKEVTLWPMVNLGSEKASLEEKLAPARLRSLKYLDDAGPSFEENEDYLGCSPKLSEEEQRFEEQRNEQIEQIQARFTVSEDDD